MLLALTANNAAEFRAEKIARETNDLVLRFFAPGETGARPDTAHLLRRNAEPPPQFAQQQCHLARLRTGIRVNFVEHEKS
ncbi:MAG: hypothetical protein ABJF10_19485 [Chthoniobacter sp.]|uniref:hypothetical protein n=1 Tax=Chthoniobacter sp. TaxID=2510640 RepID=UPI0032A22859